jgi:hypothetical protein
VPMPKRNVRRGQQSDDDASDSDASVSSNGSNYSNDSVSSGNSSSSSSSSSSDSDTDGEYRPKRRAKHTARRQSTRVGKVAAKKKAAVAASSTIADNGDGNGNCSGEEGPYTMGHVCIEMEVQSCECSKSKIKNCPHRLWFIKPDHEKRIYIWGPSLCNNMGITRNNLKGKVNNN